MIIIFNKFKRTPKSIVFICLHSVGNFAYMGKAFFEYQKERNKDLMRAFHTCMETYCGNSLEAICEKVRLTPATRFWVSEERATIVITQILKGEHPIMSQEKQDMYGEILSRVKAVMQTQPDRTIGDIVFEVVHQPAPRFYYTTASIREMIYRIKAEWYEQRKRKLRHLF